MENDITETYKKLCEKFDGDKIDVSFVVRNKGKYKIIESMELDEFLMSLVIMMKINQSSIFNRFERYILKKKFMNEITNVVNSLVLVIKAMLESNKKK